MRSNNYAVFQRIFNFLDIEKTSPNYTSTLNVLGLPGLSGESGDSGKF
jgi:hypothetical protein